MKHFFQLLLILLVANTSSCKVGKTTVQTMKENDDTTYLLGGYLINPAKKQVSVYKRTGGTEVMPDGSVMHWDGYTYTPDKTIKYNRTTLFIIGNHVFFKEKFKFFPKLDLNSLRIIRSDDDDYLLCRDKNYIYQDAIGEYVYDDEKEKIYWNSKEIIKYSGYKAINDYIYQKKDSLYVLLKQNFKLVKIEGVTLDIPTLQHLTDNFFADKNGLHLLGFDFLDSNGGWSFDQSIQLEKSNGKTITPIIKRNYFIYDDKVYSSLWNNNACNNKPLPLNADRIKELEIDNYYQICFLADDNHTYETKQNDGYSAEKFYTESFNRRYDNDFFKQNVNQWQIITARDMNFIQGDDRKTLYFPSEMKPPGKQLQDYILIKTPDGFYIFRESNGSALQKINQVFIFNFDTKEYEELDASQYRYFSDALRIYKNRVYGDDGLPVKEPIDAENLHCITHHDVKTNYLTDGKLLIYTGRMGGFTMEGEGSNTMQVLGKRIISGVDFSTLKVVTKDILIDKEYIYNGDSDGIGAIPIKALNLNVKIITE